MCVRVVVYLRYSQAQLEARVAADDVQLGIDQRKSHARNVLGLQVLVKLGTLRPLADDHTDQE